MSEIDRSRGVSTGEAIWLGRKGMMREDGGPFAAVVVSAGKIVGRGYSQDAAEIAFDDHFIYEELPLDIFSASGRRAGQNSILAVGEF